MLDEIGIATTSDLDKPMAVAQLAEDIVGHPLSGSATMGGSLSVLREKMH
jgi:hydroxymethylglutaryl-CoA lyase